MTTPTPTLLIEQDNAHLIVSREVRENQDSLRIVSRTALGWIAHGGAIPRGISTATTLALKTELPADAHLGELVISSIAVDSLPSDQRATLPDNHHYALKHLKTHGERTSSHHKKKSQVQIYRVCLWMDFAMCCIDCVLTLALTIPSWPTN